MENNNLTKSVKISLIGTALYLVFNSLTVTAEDKKTFDKSALISSKHKQVHFLQGNLGKIPYKRKITQTQIEKYIPKLKNLLNLVGNESFKMRTQWTDSDAINHIRLTQFINDRRVIGAEVILHVNSKSGAVERITDNSLKDKGLVHIPKISKKEIFSIFKNEHGEIRDGVSLQGELVYFKNNIDKPTLSWQIKSIFPGELEECGFDIPRIKKSASAGMPKIAIFSALNASELSNTSSNHKFINRSMAKIFGQNPHKCTADSYEVREWWSEDNIPNESDGGIYLSAWNNVEKTYNYYHEIGQTSYDGQDSEIKIYVMTPDSTLNQGMAFWDTDNLNIVLGAEVSDYYHMALSLDVISHEFSHGVIQSNLVGNIFTNEEKAITESFADIMAALIEHSEIPNSGANIWTIMDDIYRGGDNIGALRSLANPTLDGVSIDSYDNYNDNLDEHFSSGIMNKAFYLLAEGGFHNGIQINGLGLEAAGEIYKGVLLGNGTSLNSFDDVKYHTAKIAKNSFGENEQFTTCLTWEAVGVRSSSDVCNDFTVSSVTAQNLCRGNGNNIVTWSRSDVMDRYQVWLAENLSDFDNNQAVFGLEVNTGRNLAKIQVASDQYVKVKGCIDEHCGGFSKSYGIATAGAYCQ